ELLLPAEQVRGAGAPRLPRPGRDQRAEQLGRAVGRGLRAPRVPDREPVGGTLRLARGFLRAVRRGVLRVEQLLRETTRVGGERGLLPDERLERVRRGRDELARHLRGEVG